MIIISLVSIETYAQIEDNGHENAMKYNLYKPKKKSLKEIGELKQLYFSLGLSNEFVINLKGKDTKTSYSSIAKFSLGYKFNPYSSMEISYGFANATLPYLVFKYDDREMIDKNLPENILEANYFFNITNFSRGTKDQKAFEMTVGAGANYRFEKELQSIGVQTQMRFIYSPNYKASFFLEPKLSFSANLFESSISDRSNYYIQPAINIGMNLSLYNSNATSTTKVESSIYNNRKGKINFLAIKTNTLAWLAMIPNISVDVPIKNRWSIGVELLSSWWLNNKNTQCWELQYLALNTRYYWSKLSRDNVNLGWFASIYTGVGRYDIQREKNSGIQSELVYTLGASLGYAFAVTKIMNIELELGAGYITTNYQRYTVQGDYLVQDGYMNRYQAFTPKRVSVNLVWLIGVKKKGGDL